MTKHSLCILLFAIGSLTGAWAGDHCVMTSHGCLALNPDVTEATAEQTICSPGYTKLVRPGTAYTNGVKHKLMREQGIPSERAGDYELDHVVPLTLGGHPRQLSNLMLQPWEGDHGAKVKDKLEVRLKNAVCKGRMSLTEAQTCIAENWETCQGKHPGRKSQKR
jgi:hypothetical protein